MLPVRELELLCDHARRPGVARGIVYRYTGTAEAPIVDAPPPIQRVGYALVEMGDTLWAHRGDDTYARRIDYHGPRCKEGRWHCPRGIGASFTNDQGDGTAEAPWGQTPGRGARGLGEQFFDPATTMKKRLALAPPYSLDYTWNPYVGIAPPS
jgi:hypothetical protein